MCCKVTDQILTTKDLFYVCLAHMCLCVPAALGGQKEVSDSLELDLLMAVNHYMYSRD